MASWDETSPMIKFEDSPAESFVSTPGEFYPSLFADDGAEHEDVHTIEPSEMLTPPTFVDEAAATSTPTPRSAATPSPATPGTSDKKMVKKRKSWGQVLPEPKTNLPPRKRAKTEDEKEQRRVERVLRNRRAAQSSRERKRLEVEALERRNKQLEAALQNVTKTNQLLVKELSKFRRDSGLLARSSSPLDSLCSNAVTLSQQLFSSQDSHRKSLDEGSLVDDLISSQPSATVNPASLSPELAPIAENDVAGVEGGHMAETNTGNSSSDLTQRPAAMLCDLQCQQSENLYQSWLAFRTPAHPTLTFFLQLQMLGLLSSPNSLDYENDYLVGDSATFIQDSFDITQFLHDEDGVNSSDANLHDTGVTADTDFGFELSHPENQGSPENSNLQPHSGASAYGCDDGGIAVGI
ncbi:Transcriptional activator hac1 [Colletotrichum trifolii]|uniref:Transcriptional activator hac1 n=1 Tax=Colletotrichum trifolii TaxID=5466 RepID=A0A4R8PUR1_COLTR|nr:Transcriptional activator hac1 [Colletotrichum trifolii]